MMMTKRVNLTLWTVMVMSTVTATQLQAQHPVTDVYDGWRLGVQAWSFKNFTFFEAVDKTQQLGLNWIQAYPGQRVAPDIDARMGYDLPESIRQAIREKLAASNVRMAAFGVLGIPDNEAEARRLYEFARDMGIEVLVSEPPAERFDLIDKLCQEYEIKLAIHNHPKPTRYWHPDNVLEALEGRSKWIGVSVDVGHWRRSALDPVECLKRLEGRIYDVHMKEVDTNLGHDVVWGTGQGWMRPILEELHRQGYKGMFAAEYEHSWDNNVPLIRRSVAYFNEVASTLNPSGWRDLFYQDFSNASMNPGTWQWEQGVLAWRGGGYIWTKERYGDFILDLEFKVAENSNSGVFFRTDEFEQRRYVQTGIEVQIHDSTDRSRRGQCGAIYDIQSPSKPLDVFMRPTGQWNRMTLVADGSRLWVLINGHQIINMDLDDWTEPGKNPDGTSNKFNTAYKDMSREGHIGLQDHSDPVWYRNLKIKELK